MPAAHRPGRDAGAAMTNATKNLLFAQLDEIKAVRCPCGWPKRAFPQPDNQVATIHYVDIQEDARTHYHTKLTEIYLILEGEGFMELDGEMIPVKQIGRAH